MKYLLMPDVDGTMFDIGARLAYALWVYTKNIPDELAYLRTEEYAREDATYWGTVFRSDLLYKDVPIEGVREDLDTFEQAGFKIVAHTSRPDSMLDATMYQLKQHGFMTSTRELIMKPEKMRIATKMLKVAYAYGQVSAHRYPSFVFVDDNGENQREVEKYVSPICRMKSYSSMAQAAADLRQNTIFS